MVVPKIIITVQRLTEFHNAQNSLGEEIQTAQKQSELARGNKAPKKIFLKGSEL